jgi:hypothetical protein
MLHILIHTRTYRRMGNLFIYVLTFALFTYLISDFEMG